LLLVFSWVFVFFFYGVHFLFRLAIGNCAFKKKTCHAEAESSPGDISSF